MVSTASWPFESRPTRLHAPCAGVLDPQSSRPAPTAAVGPHCVRAIKFALNLKARSILFWKVPWEEQTAQVRSVTPNPANGYGAVNQRRRPLRVLPVSSGKQKSAEGRLLELPAQVSRMKFNITPIGTRRASGIGGVISALGPNFLDLPVPRDGIF